MTSTPVEPNLIASLPTPDEASWPSIRQLGALSGTALLVACGGETSDMPQGFNLKALDGASGNIDPASSYLTEVGSAQEASRFLAQAAFGGTLDEINALTTSNFETWINQQLGMVRSESHYDWLIRNGYGALLANGTPNSAADHERTLWFKLIKSPDVLRQRITLALTEFFVVNYVGTNTLWRGLVLARYVDILERDAFGNFKDLLKDVTLSLAMGNFLNLSGSYKATAAGAQPDENYAREVMQLFSIGLHLLNQDGTPKLDSSGTPLESYTQADVTALAHMLTGWTNPTTDYKTDLWAYTGNMIFVASRHSTIEKVFMGHVTPAGSLDGQGELNKAIDILFNHPNVGPFFGAQLIQRLVTSNPSPAYVSRVAAAFNDNGNGVRGDMPTVIKAVLLDPEARTRAPDEAMAGMLREPMVRLIQWARTFNLSPVNTTTALLWPVGDLSSNTTALSQSPLRAPSVFNFFRPGFRQKELNALAPEFQIANEITVTSYVNFMAKTVVDGLGGKLLKPIYTDWTALAHDSQELVNRLNLVLAAGQLSTTTTDLIVSTLNAVALTGTSTQITTIRTNRVYAAILLIMSSSEYLVLK